MEKYNTNHDKINIFLEYTKSKYWFKFNKISNDKLSSWDISYTSGTTQVIGKIQMQNFASNALDGIFISKHTIESLHAIRSNIKAKYKDSTIPPTIHFINIFTDGQIIIWDITNLSNVMESHNLQSKLINVPSDSITLPIFTSTLRESLSPIPYGNDNADANYKLPF